MATRAPSSLLRIYTGLESKYGSVIKRGGIVGDLAHRQRGGFHISREDQPSTNYSVYNSFNRNGPDDLAAAIDITTSTDMMRVLSGRLRRAVDEKDPRVWNVVFEWFGTLNNSTVTGDLLYNTGGRSIGRTTSDSSHLWHVHISFRRDRVAVEKYIDAVRDVLLGVPRPAIDPDNKEFEVATVGELKAAIRDVLAEDGNMPNYGFLAGGGDEVSYQSTFAGLGRKIDSVQKDVDSLQSSVATKTDVAGVKSEVDRTEEDIVTIRNAVSSLSTAVSGYRNEVSGLNAKLDAVLNAVQGSTDESTTA